MASKAGGAEEKVKSVENVAANIGKEDKVADEAGSETGDIDKMEGSEGNYSGEGVGKEDTKRAGNPLKNYLVKDFNEEMAKLPHAQISTEIRVVVFQRL